MRELRYKIAGVLEAVCEWGGTKREIVFLVLGGVSLLVSLSGVVELPFDAAWVAIILCGVPIILEAVIGLITVFDIKADVLVSLALIASVATGQDFAAGEVAFIMQLGALLEDLTVAKARAGIERLVQLTPQTARRISGGEEIIPATEVRVGDVLCVLPGETIPVDGVIISGETSVDQAVMTGESLPVDKGVGDEVSSGTVNRFGSFDMRATRVGEDSSIQRMIRLVQSADAGKAKIVGLADRWATWIVVIALSAAAITWAVTGEIIRAVTILVVFCPCALVLATPTAIMAAIGNATKHGFLVREGDALERLAGVKRVCFDKTGTLTRGEMRVRSVKSCMDGVNDDALYSLAAGAEARSEHPLGRAIVECCRDAGHVVPDCSDFSMLPGRGVSAVVNGSRVLAGRAELLSDEGVPLPEAVLSEARRYAGEGCTTIYLALDGKAAGFIALADTVRDNAAEVISGVKAAGYSPVLLTGDHPGAAMSIASGVGIDEVHAECLPQDKIRYIDEYSAEGGVCMIGDGINDAPALKRADTGIAMGGIGSDIAIDAADIALVNDDITELPHLLRLSKRMMTTIKLNIAFSMCLNFLAIGLAIPGILGPVIGALVHNAGSVLVIINSSLLLGWKDKG